MGLATPLLAAALGVLCGSGLFVFLGLEPVVVFRTFFVSPFRDLYSIGELSLKVAPLALCAVGLAIEPITYLSLACFAGVSWFLYRSRAGLVLRGVGDAPESAHAVGYRVIAIRYLAVLFGGGMAGLAGVFLSVYYTPPGSRT